MGLSFRFATALLVAVALPTIACGQNTASDPWAEVGRILGTANVSTTPYHRYNLPRTDLRVRIRDVDVAAGIALGAWVGFSGEPEDATTMGDLVVTGAELGPVLAELAQRGIDVTAIHNHLAGETPQVIYVHFQAQGEVRDLATRIDGAVRLTGTPRPVSAPRPEAPTIDTTEVFTALGRSGTANGAIAKVSFQLIDGAVTIGGRPVNAAMSHGTPINLQMVDGDRVVATGDFAIRGSAVAPVLRALAAGGIVATAVHSHLIDETPQVRYIHFWADGPLPDVLRGLRSAIDAAR